jgi:hypothetical protein
MILSRFEETTDSDVTAVSSAMSCLGPSHKRPHVDDLGSRLMSCCLRSSHLRVMSKNKIGSESGNDTATVTGIVQ